ncbi:MAG: hypothetical protein ACOYK8_06560 [Alphaproteobacteria bacterium]
MDVVVTLVSDYLTGKATDHLVDVFRRNVIERWSKWRAEKFLETFYSEISILLNASDPQKLNEALDKILQHEERTEVLFDAYRSVSLSRSKNIGPRIIAVITAKLTYEKRTATMEEEIILSAAEMLNDNELIEYASFVSKYKGEANSKNKDALLDEKGNLRIRWCEEQQDSNWHRETEISVSPLNLTSVLGVWATKLKNLGIIVDEVIEKKWAYKEDSERHIDQDGEVREIIWWIAVDKEFFFLANLIDRFKHTAE